MNLGQMLATNIKKATEAERDRLARIEERKQKILQEEARRIENFFLEVRTNITDTILNGGKVKSYKVTKPVEKVIETNRKSAELENPNMQIIENTFLKWATENGLQGKIVPCHDGMGVESWWEVTVVPMENYNV